MLCTRWQRGLPPRRRQGWVVTSRCPSHLIPSLLLPAYTPAWAAAVAVVAGGGRGWTAPGALLEAVEVELHAQAACCGYAHSAAGGGGRGARTGLI
jgi:hypothetical protein